jgi:hypothetical protein
MYGVYEYLMIMHELEKVRRARKSSRNEEPSPSGSPPSAKGKHTRQRTLRR